MKIINPIRRAVPVLSALALLCAACSQDSFKIKGDISGADNQLVILEKADFGGRWIVLDSVRTDGSGHFTLAHSAPDAPEIFRLRVGDGFAYVPVDSTETVTLNADSRDFAGTWTLGGSERASEMSDFEHELRNFIPHATNPDSAKSFKRRVYSRYIQNARGSVIAYYILTRTVNDNRPLFDPANREDLGIFSAVATAFREYRPEDPRTPLLENTVINARRSANSSEGRKLVIEAEESGLIPIVLPDENGQDVALASVAGHGKPTILMFGVMSVDATVAANRAIARIMERRGGDLAVYSVSFDSDAGFWREAARNLPWVTVLDHNATSSVATDYNIPSVPCYYIIDRDGNLVDRTNDIMQVEELVRKHS